MNFITKFIYRHIVPSLGRLVLGRNKYINVIYYHDIVDKDAHSYMRTDKDVFKKHMQALAEKGFKTFTFDDLNEDKGRMIFKSRNILITFDDGWKSNYTILPMMKQLGLKYNVFLEVGKIGTDPNYLSWDEIREMHNSGMVGFGAHTFNHVNMSKIENYAYDDEILKANEIIEKEIGWYPKDFCFPFGAYCEESLSQLVESGEYDRIYTSDMTYSYLRDFTYIMGRNAISTDDSEATLKAKSIGAFNIFKSLVELCRK